MTLSERVTELCIQHGGLRAAARAIQVEVGYLSRLGSGEKVNPLKDTLRKMGLRRVVTYERVSAPKPVAEASEQDRKGSASDLSIQEGKA